MIRLFFAHRNLFLLSIVLFSSCGPDLPENVKIAYDDLPQELDFNIHVKPILSDKCYACHGPDKANQKAGLRLDEPNAAYNQLPESPGKVAIKKGDLNGSEVFHRIISDDPQYQMPTPEFKVPLSDYEKAVLIKWIEDGAEYKEHWAFIKPEQHHTPKVKSEFVINDIDNFVIERLNQEGLSLSKESDRELLLRRVSFDLTGLPPSPQEIEAFTNDKSENAYEKQVDRLLASRHYGEKMATDWMDLSRYSDTYGYQIDRYRDMSPWRDWVIKAFNDNLSYDQFITWQLAGDLLPEPNADQVIATAFNRLHAMNMEDGIVGEEFRAENVSDRVAVVGQGLMAMTLACAKCHDHKYDPISQKNFFEFYGYFNTINESGQIAWDETTPVPTQILPTTEQKEILDYLDRLSNDRLKELQRVVDRSEEPFKEWLEQENYRTQLKSIGQQHLLGYYKLDNRLTNDSKYSVKGLMRREMGKIVKPLFTKGFIRNGLQFDGDAWLDLGKVGVFKRSDQFSIGLWVYIPEDLNEGVLFHKNQGTSLHSYKGYHVYLRDNKLEVMLAHTWPDNAIIEHSINEIPKNKWTHVMMTYDGSSTAKGTRLFVNGEEWRTETEIDNLYKDIIFHNYEDDIYRDPIEPGLQIGGRWRGKGLKGGKVDEIKVYNHNLSALEVKQVANSKDIKSLVKTAYSNLSESDINLLKEYYLKNVNDLYQKAVEELNIAQTAYADSVEYVKEIMVMREMDKPRKTFILERGEYDNPTEEVFPNVPENIMPMPSDFPKNRLGLAQWLTDTNNPLTARVAVNRYWQNFFGRGIVRTTEDFGNQGELPSHPKLLDWLALRFIKSGWDVKALQKMIVMSATYRQSSYTSQELLALDPSNVLLARGPSTRLTSEMMRDNALIASGLFNPKVGGESVKPYQPAGLWLMNNGKYVQDTGNKLYRRSVYTYWKRTIPNPTLSTFDQPDRNECTVRRQKTNTPLQALVLLNDPTYLEASKVIGENMTRIVDDNKSIEYAFMRLTGRQPKLDEIEILRKVKKTEYETFKNDSLKIKGWIEAGQYNIDKSLDLNLVAANAIVASVILNSDATITKR